MSQTQYIIVGVKDEQPSPTNRAEQIKPNIKLRFNFLYPYTYDWKKCNILKPFYLNEIISYILFFFGCSFIQHFSSFYKELFSPSSNFLSFHLFNRLVKLF